MPSGGSATSYGILFQILGSLYRACELRLDATARGGDIHRAQLVLEPSRGGDVTIQTESGRTVEQWKSRRTGRPWTIREIVRQVLPDLYAATADGALSGPSQYHFRAEGTIGDWSNAQLFFEELRRFDPKSFCVELLNDKNEAQFLGGRGGLMSERHFFLWVASQIGGKGQGPKRRVVAVDHQRLCHLLANFYIPRTES